MDDRAMNFHSSILQVASIIKNKEQIKAKQKLEIEKKKRDRKANYSKEETDRLVDLILLKKDILENKKNNADLWNEKREAWEDIANQFNKKTRSGIYRDSKTLRIKYESLKRDIKRKWNDILAKRKNSIGKIPKFTTSEKKLKEIISLPMEGYCDFDTIEDNNDNKSDDDGTSYTSISDNEDIDCSNLKTEDIELDEGLAESTVKTIYLDPLVEQSNAQRIRAIDDDTSNKKTRENIFVGAQDKDKAVDKNDTGSEKMKNKLQIELLQEELEIKKLQRRIFEQELEQKNVMHELEKTHILLKINALKAQLIDS